jgi:hypothetical protein
VAAELVEDAEVDDVLEADVADATVGEAAFAVGEGWDKELDKWSVPRGEV